MPLPAPVGVSATSLCPPVTRSPMLEEGTPGPHQEGRVSVRLSVHMTKGPQSGGRMGPRLGLAWFPQHRYQV